MNFFLQEFFLKGLKELRSYHSQMFFVFITHHIFIKENILSRI